ncbi:hypothetical protein Tco_0110307 [Tanacetum coccineum]
MVSSLKDPLTFNDLMATPIDFSKYVLNGLKIENLTQDILLGPSFNLLKGTCTSSIELEYNFQECFNALTNKLDWNNPERDQVTYTTSITKTKAARYEIKGIEDMVSKFSKKNVYSTKAILGVKSLFHLDGNVIVDFIVAFRMFTRGLILKRRVEDLQLGVECYHKKLNITKPQKTFPDIEFKEPYTPSYDPLRISVRDEIHHIVLDFCLDYNTEMPKRKWMAVDRKKLGLMIELIDKHLREREIIINPERLVGARELEMDYKLMTRTV